MCTGWPLIIRYLKPVHRMDRVANMEPIPAKHLSFILSLIFLTFSPTSSETGLVSESAQRKWKHFGSQLCFIIYVLGLLVVGGEGGLQSVEFWTPPPLSGSKRSLSKYDKHRNYCILKIHCFERHISAQCFLSDLPHWNFFHSLDSLNGEVWISNFETWCFNIVSIAIHHKYISASYKTFFRLFRVVTAVAFAWKEANGRRWPS